MAVAELAMRKCIPCEGTKPMIRQEAGSSLEQLPGWTLVDNAIEKEFRFKSYSAGMDFAYALGKIPEEQDHRPEVMVRWRRVELAR